TLGAFLFVFMQHEAELEKLKQSQGPGEPSKTDPKSDKGPKVNLPTAPDSNKPLSKNALASLDEWNQLNENDQNKLMVALAKRMDGFRYLGLKAFQCGGYGSRVGQFQHLQTDVIMHLVPGGEFTLKMQGKTVSAKVSPFLIGQAELTQEEWDKGTVKGLDSRMGRHPGKPMTGISWISAKEWGAAYSLRIPSETEWMWAYRGGNGATYFWGERPDHRYFWDRTNAKDVHEGKDHRGYENGFGLVDIAGNLSEFVADPITVALPDGHIHKGWPFRLIRGGSFKHEAERATVMSRKPMIQQGRSRSVGVRFVFSVPGFPTTKDSDYGRSFDFTKLETPSLISLLYNRERWNQSSKGTQNTVIKQVSVLLGKNFKVLGGKTAICGAVQHRVGSFLHIPSNMKFRLIPGGRFVMGDAKFPRTSPESMVHLAPFLLTYFPVTQEEFDRYRGVDKREQKDPLFPIHNVSFNDAKLWLASVGDGFRLPSEAEWEYAARAGTRGRYFWGDRYNPKYCHVRTHKNPRLKRTTEHRTAWNAFGLSDVLGHVWELCEDNWIPNLKKIPPGGGPRYLENTDKHVIRGHSTWDTKEKLHIATRRPIGAADRARSVGFRACISIPRLRRKR
ncbi:MAG: SUMF1/EgtB/PvdO family nonheme iron enzyme, partial [Planctomycetota bacterium]|nr:SUMF1/EgtB/PvdO family nonheme iron enzyme [Planctomycetota bacterium]